MRFLPGDIVFERSESWIGKAIRWFSRRPGEPATWANHVGLIFKPGWIIEALWSVVVSRFQPGPIYEVWRNKDLPAIQRDAVADWALLYKGRKYGVLKIAAHALDAFVTKLRGEETYLARRLCRMDRYPICSWLVAWSYLKGAGLKFGVEPEFAGPDDIHDFVKRKDSGWVRVA